MPDSVLVWPVLGLIALVLTRLLAPVLVWLDDEEEN